MTLTKAKEIVAKKLRFKNWNALRDHHSARGIEITMGEVAELYAKSKTNSLCDKCGTKLTVGLFCPNCE